MSAWSGDGTDSLRSNRLDAYTHADGAAEAAVSEVPDVSGMSVASAERQLIARGLELGAVTEQPSDEVAGLDLAEHDVGAYPDFHIRLESLAGDGDLVVKRYVVTGTHQGELGGLPPSGNKIEFTGMTMFRVKNGKIVESWWNYDLMTNLQQIGAIPQSV
jgi:predicted ester cyclase